MNIRLYNDNLQSVIKKLSKIKSNLVIKASGSMDIVLTKRDINTSISERLSGEVYDSGSVNISESTENLLKRLNDNMVIDDNKIICGSKTISILNMGEAEHKEEVFQGEIAFSTTEKELSQLLKVKFATAKDNTRPILTGICFNGPDVVALDGYRLAKRVGSYTNPYHFVLYIDTVEALYSILDPKSFREVSVEYSKNKVRFSIGEDTTIIGDLLEGEFIKYSSIISDEFTINVEMEAEDIKKEFKFIKGLMINRLTMDFTKDLLTLSMNYCEEELDKQASDKRTQELTEEAQAVYKEDYKLWTLKKEKAAREKKVFKTKAPKEKNIRQAKVYYLVPISTIKSTVKCSMKGADDFSIGFNPKYIEEALNNYEGKINFKMDSCVSPVVITQDNKNLDLVLPMRIN